MAYLIDNNQIKWTMKGSYPASWMLFCAVMLHAQFVGCICGPYWHNIIPTHVYVQGKGHAQDWMAPPHRKPPDPQYLVQ